MCGNWKTLDKKHPNFTEKGINQTFLFKKKLLTPSKIWFKNTANILDQIPIEMVIIRIMGLQIHIILVFF